MTRWLLLKFVFYVSFVKMLKSYLEIGGLIKINTIAIIVLLYLLLLYLHHLIYIIIT